MKKILLSAFAMLLAVTANAQNFTVEKLQSPLGVQIEAFGAQKAPAKVKVAKTSVSWVSMMILRLVTIT